MIVQTVLFAITIVLVKCSNAEYNVEKYCQLIEPGTKLASLESCQNYYTCLGSGMSIKSTCPDANVFDKDAQTCVPESESNCLFGLSNPCQNKSHEFAYNSKGCNWYNYCIDGQIAGSGTCVFGERFYPANGSCIYGNCDDSVQRDVVDMCNIMPDGVYFGDFENCHNWHKCSALRREDGVCTGSLVFDVASGFCLENKGNMCQRTNNVVPSLASGPPNEACTSPSQMVGDTNVCSIYYTCQVNPQTPGATYEWKQQNCKNQYFDVMSQQCRDVSLARVYPGCDRCQLLSGHASTYWVNAVDPNCRQYLTCNNGKRVGASLGNCAKDHFFDEKSQYCIASEELLDQYENYVGACQQYTCTDSRVCSLPA